MTLKELEARIQTLEDNQAIKKLQSAYGYYLEHWDGQQIVDLFSDGPNTSVEEGPYGVYVGQEGIKQYFLRDNLPPEFLHVLMQVSEIVDVDPGGKTAKGRWYGFGPQAKPIYGGGRYATSLAGSGERPIRAQWMFGVYENEFVKEDGKWKYKKIIFNGMFATPYEDGWVKTPKVPLPSRLPDRPEPKRTFFKQYTSGCVLPYHYKNPVRGK